jgi:hypothetical protein
VARPVGTDNQAPDLPANVCGHPYPLQILSHVSKSWIHSPASSDRKLGWADPESPRDLTDREAVTSAVLREHPRIRPQTRHLETLPRRGRRADTARIKRWHAFVVLVSVPAVALALILTTAKAAPRDLASAEQVWRQEGIENYTLDIAVDGCMVCGGPEPLRYSVVVANGEKTSETDPPGQKPGYAPTVEGLFRLIEGYGPDGTVATYNDVGVPIEMRLDMPDVEDDQAHYTVTFTET